MLLARSQTPFDAKIRMSFISGSSNYRLSALKDQDNSACHQCAIREKRMKKPLQLENPYHQKNSASSTYFRITNIFRYPTGEWKRPWNFIKTLRYFLSYRVTKTTVSSLSKPSCVRETLWCKVYRRLLKWKCL